MNFTAHRSRLPPSTDHAQTVSLPGSTGPPQAARLQAARLQAARPQAARSVSYCPDGVCSSKSSSTKPSPTKSPTKSSSVQDLVKKKEGKNSLLKQVIFKNI